MPHRPDPDTHPELDLAEERALADAIEAYEEERRTLAEMSDIAREIIEATEEYMKAIAEDAVAGDAVQPGFDPAASIVRLAETIRLNDALDAELARDLQARVARSMSKAPNRGRAPPLSRTTGSGATVH